MTDNHRDPAPLAGRWLHALLLTVALAPAALAQERVPLPDAKLIEDAQKTVREIYAKELAATKTPEILEFVALLRKQAAESKGDPPAVYGMLREALPLAAKVGEEKLVFQILDELSDAFVLDAATQKSLLAVATVKDPEATKAMAAMKVLADKPDDPASVQAVGKYRALILEDWTRGLTLLATDAGGPWKELATKDLANPTTADEMNVVANLWADAGTKETAAPYKQGAQERALIWYVRAAGQLTGLAQMQAKKRIEALRSRPGRTASAPGLFATYYLGEFKKQLKTGRAENLFFDQKHAAIAPGVPTDNYSVRFIGNLKIPFTGVYYFRLSADDVATLWLDGENRITYDYNKEKDKGKPKDIQLTLKAGSLPFLLTFYEMGGEAFLKPLWKIPGTKEFEQIPAANLSHDPTRVIEYQDQTLTK